MSFDGFIASHLQCSAAYQTPEAVQMAPTDGDYEFPAESFAGNPLKTPDMAVDERLAERIRIAQDLHDTLLQGFLSASMQLHVAVDRLPPASAAKSPLSRILSLMSQVIEEGRNAVRGLRSPQGTSLDLGQAFSRIQQELDIAEDVGFRVIVD